MKILIIGSGGREHALLKSVLTSNRVSQVFSTPGNTGMALESVCVALHPTDFEGLISLAKREKIDLTVVGPELPLTQGVVNVFEGSGLRIFGPTKEASVLEGSKVFAKEFCRRHHIPTAGFAVFSNADLARRFLAEKNTFPIVIKADGLAAGKGVCVAGSREEALTAVSQILVEREFGEAGKKILIEDFLEGSELSYIVMSDGENFVTLPTAQDHKRLLDNDEGPNTGGMGAYAPAGSLTAELEQKIIRRIIAPTLMGMKAESRAFRGFLYAGLMISPQGEPFLLEYNCRLGDPEAQVILPLLKSDFVELMLSALEGGLKNARAEFYAKSVVGVVLASAGYPGNPRKGDVIGGCEKIVGQDVWLVHAGTKREGDRLVTDGGRVLTVVARGGDLKTAIKRVYEAVSLVSWTGCHYRRDIGLKGLS